MPNLTAGLYGVLRVQIASNLIAVVCMYVYSHSWERNSDFRRCRNVVALLSSVMLATHCHVFTVIGSWFKILSPKQVQILIITKHVTEKIPQPYCDNVLSAFYLAIMYGESEPSGSRNP